MALEAPRETFEEIAPSLMRWQLGLGAAVLVVLLACRAPAPVWGGFLVGWMLSLAGLAHIGERARQAEGLEPRARVILGIRTHMQRFLGSILGCLIAIHLGAHPVAVVGALGLLQAAVVCRSMVKLIWPGEPGAGDGPAGSGDPSKED